ncbi:hypothetical protein SCUCBS95973_003378 [Sporothrix curviconia]|uniref:Carbohydrate-binding module family 18 protein n=1 Tax=Sporothrix curviconia TaxID=1260050 RepID=A0ABP0BET8_9PEZI
MGIYSLPPSLTLTVIAQDGDTCASLATTWGTTVTAFVQNNPGISSCAKLTVGASYCIDKDVHGGSGGTKPGGGSPASTSGAPSSSPPANKVSLDGTCGSGYTCVGSKFGTCCSAHGWCGSTADHCGAGCQAAFGDCVLPVAGNGTTTKSAGPPPPVTTTPGNPATTPSSHPPLPPPPPPPPPPPASTSPVSQVTHVQTVWTTLTTTRTTTTTTTTTAWVTNTAYATNTANVTSTAVVTQTQTQTQTHTQTWTATATGSTVLTSTAVTTAMVTRTTTTTHTRIDVSIITTITTVTLVMSITDRSHIASLCGGAQTLAHGLQSTGTPVAALASQTPSTEAPSIILDARSPHDTHAHAHAHTPPRILLEPCCGTEIVQCAASTPGLGDDERRSVSSMARRAALSMPGMDVCCGALYNCL